MIIPSTFKMKSSVKCYLPKISYSSDEIMYGAKSQRIKLGRSKSNIFSINLLTEGRKLKNCDACRVRSSTTVNKKK